VDSRAWHVPLEALRADVEPCCPGAELDILRQRSSAPCSSDDLIEGSNIPFLCSALRRSASSMQLARGCDRRRLVPLLWRLTVFIGASARTRAQRVCITISAFAFSQLRSRAAQIGTI
jgi:hypothetical protein